MSNPKLNGRKQCAKLPFKAMTKHARERLHGGSQHSGAIERRWRVSFPAGLLIPVYPRGQIFTWTNVLAFIHPLGFKEYRPGNRHWLTSQRCLSRMDDDCLCWEGGNTEKLTVCYIMLRNVGDSVSDSSFSTWNCLRLIICLTLTSLF